MSTGIGSQSAADHGHITERNVGRGLALVWVALAAFVPASVVGWAVNNTVANLAWMAIIGGCGYAIWEWERVSAWIIGALAAAAIVLIPITGMAGGADMQKVLMFVLPGFVVPGLAASVLLLHSERRRKVSQETAAIGDQLGPGA